MNQYKPGWYENALLLAIVFAFVGAPVVYVATTDTRNQRLVEEYEFIKKGGGDPRQACRIAQHMVDRFKAARNLEEYTKWNAAVRDDCGVSCVYGQHGLADAQ